MPGFVTTEIGPIDAFLSMFYENYYRWIELTVNIMSQMLSRDSLTQISWNSYVCSNTKKHQYEKFHSIFVNHTFFTPHRFNIRKHTVKPRYCEHWYHKHPTYIEEFLKSRRVLFLVVHNFQPTKRYLIITSATRISSI